jgi:hypothetical protein
VHNVGTGAFIDLADGDKTWFRTVYKYAPMRPCIQHHFKGDKAAFVSEWGIICDVPSKFKKKYCTGEGEYCSVPFAEGKS